MRSSLLQEDDPTRSPLLVEEEFMISFLLLVEDRTRSHIPEEEEPMRSLTVEN